jgi:hypothetical protein
MGMITIITMMTAPTMIPSVEPASLCGLAVASTVPVCRTGVAVASCGVADMRLSARLVNKIAIPNKAQNVIGTVRIFDLILALLDFKYIIQYQYFTKVEKIPENRGADVRPLYFHEVLNIQGE